MEIVIEICAGGDDEIHESALDEGHDDRPPEITIHQGVLQLMTMVAPYLGDKELSFYRDCESIYANLLDQAG